MALFHTADPITGKYRECCPDVIPGLCAVFEFDMNDSSNAIEHILYDGNAADIPVNIPLSGSIASIRAAIKAALDAEPILYEDVLVTRSLITGTGGSGIVYHYIITFRNVESGILLSAITGSAGIISLPTQTDCT